MSEYEQRQQAEQLVATVAAETREQGVPSPAVEAKGMENAATESAECWLISIDRAASLSPDAGQEILQTLRQKFRVLEVSADPLASGQLQVPDRDYHKLSAQLWDRIKVDWPEVVRQKKACQSVAPANNLH